MANVSRFLTRPLYLQVRDVLAERITNGHWKAGATIPNEIELARELQISVGTVRKALEQLENERLVNRQQGRGTFVKDHSSEEMATRFENLRDREGRRLPVAAAPARIESGQATDKELATLQLRPGDSVVRIERVHGEGGRAFMMAISTVPQARFPDLPSSGEAPSLVVELALHHGVLLSRAEERITAESADEKAAAALDVDAGAPLLKLDRIVYAIDGRPVEGRIALCHLAGKHYLTEFA